MSFIDHPDRKSLMEERRKAERPVEKGQEETGKKYRLPSSAAKSAADHRIPLTWKEALDILDF